MPRKQEGSPRGQPPENMCASPEASIVQPAATESTSPTQMSRASRQDTGTAGKMISPDPPGTDRSRTFRREKRSRARRAFHSGRPSPLSSTEASGRVTPALGEASGVPRGTDANVASTTTQPARRKGAESTRAHSMPSPSMTSIPGHRQQPSATQISGQPSPVKTKSQTSLIASEKPVSHATSPEDFFDASSPRKFLARARSDLSVTHEPQFPSMAAFTEEHGPSKNATTSEDKRATSPKETSPTPLKPRKEHASRSKESLPSRKSSPPALGRTSVPSLTPETPRTPSVRKKASSLGKPDTRGSPIADMASHTPERRLSSRFPEAPSVRQQRLSSTAGSTVPACRKHSPSGSLLAVSGSIGAYYTPTSSSITETSAEKRSRDVLKERRSRGRSREGSRSRLTTDRPRYSTFLLCLSFFFVAAFFLVVAVLLVLMKRRDSPVVCHSAACTELNDLLTASINATVKPCDNFYRHVCGGSPTGRPASVYWKHLDRFGRDLISVNTEALIPQSGQTPAQKATLFLRTCLLAIRFEVNSQVAMFRDKFTSLGVSWPHISNVPNVLATATKVYATFRVAPLLEVARSRVGDGDKPYLSVGPGGVLPAWKDKRDRLIESGSYEQFYKETAKLYTSSSVTAEGIDFKQFQLLEGSVLEKLVYAERNHAAVAALSTVRHLQDITTNVDPHAWRTLVTSELGLEESTPVKVRNRDYLVRFNDVIGQVGEADLHFYLGWCVVQAAARLMSRSLSDLWYNETRPVLDDRADLTFSSPSTADCLQLTEFAVGWALFDTLMRTRADTPVRDSITTMAGNIGMNLVKRIEAAQWLNQNSSSPVTKLDFEEVLYHSSRFMDENTLDKLFANVSDMHDMLFTNWVNAVRSTSQMPKSAWDQVSSTYLTNVRTKPYFAAFDARSQSIRVPPYLLTMPVFDKDLTDGAKYGLLGTLIGAASIRLLLARLSHDSRASELAEARKRMDCYAGSQTNAVQRERLHMAASVPVVWEAFLTAKLFGRGDRRGLRDFPSEKLFFVTMCYLLCDDRYLPEGAELTCNTAASNSPAFKTTFRCKAGTPMNPKKKCVMF